MTSAALLAMLWNLGEFRRYTGAGLVCWFLVAGYCQFFGGSPVARAAGLLFQTILAIVLSLRWKHSG
jgi:hypothetical protein